LPRTKTFDVDHTLIAIGQIFWRNGYSATGMDQISDHLSLKKTSIYNAYGNKAALFRKVVDWYVEDVLNQCAVFLKGENQVSREMAELLRQFLTPLETDSFSNGCLLTTGLMELQYSEPDLFNYVRRQINYIPDYLIGYLTDACKAGKLKPDADPVLLGRYLFTVLQGLNVQSRTAIGLTDLEGVIAVAINPIADAEPDVRSHASKCA